MNQKKSFYTANGVDYTVEGANAIHGASAEIGAIFKCLLDDGYTVHEITGALHRTVTCWSTWHVLEHQAKRECKNR